MPPVLLFLIAVLFAGWSPALMAFVPSGSDADDSRWTLTANGPTGVAGDPATLTWSIVPDGTSTLQVDQSTRLPSDLIATFDAEFGAGPGGADLTQRPWFVHFQNAFDRWSELTGVDFVYEPNDSTALHGLVAGQLGVRGDVRIAGIGMDGVDGTLAYNFFPDGGGDMALDTDDIASFADSANNYRYLRNVIMHEAGHGLGLDHTSSNNSNMLMEPSILTSFDGPQHDDLRGIHWYYGDALEKTNGGAGNDTYTNAYDLGQLVDGGALAKGTDGSGTVILESETDFLSIANEDDPDYFRFTITEGMRIDAVMTPRGASYNQGATAFDTTSTSDLELALFDSNGTSLLAESDSGAAGDSESILAWALPAPGDYYVRVRSQSNASDQVVQFYQLDLTGESLLPGLNGDFNSDGVVDAADYTLWRDTLGDTVPIYSGADHNGSGDIDQGDYGLWAVNYGQTASLAVSAPEPAAALLAALGLLGVVSRRG